MGDQMKRWVARTCALRGVLMGYGRGAEPEAPPNDREGALPSDRGDVPGWVLVTIMTAGLVAALWAVAGDALVAAFTAAIQDTVGGP